MIEQGVRLAEILGALGLFADLADGFAQEKVMRTTVLATSLARLVGASDEETRDTYYTSILRYAGCVAFSHEEAHEFGAGDDLSVRSAMALADPTNALGTVRGIVTRVGAGRPVLDRTRAILRLATDKGAIKRHAHSQCESSLWLARLVGASAPVLTALEQICERYDGLGAPLGTRGSDLRLNIRISHIADVAEIAFHRRGRDAAMQEVERRSGRHFDPDLARVFLTHAPALLGKIEGSNVWETYLECEPTPHAIADGPKVDIVARALGALADLKSVYTVGHSARVARLARAAAESLALDPTMLERAGHVHDLGRVAIPNAVWDHPGALSLGDRERVRMHAYYTERILRRAGALSRLAVLASAAHERKTGDGYPRSVSDPGLAAEVLAAADVLAALGEDRPHRKAFAADAARTEMDDLVTKGELSRRAVDAVLAAAGYACAKPVREHPLTDREVEVIQWLARGKSNREIGTLLSISPRTVQNHIANIYDKLGLYSRAGATLWAVERNLIS